LVPQNAVHSKYFLGNGSNPVVGISIRWAPVPGYSPSGGIVDELHGVAKFADNLLVCLSSHVGVSPGVDGDVILQSLVGKCEHIRVGNNVNANEVMCGVYVLGLKKLI
jgi:hypothetical protein